MTQTATASSFDTVNEILQRPVLCAITEAEKDAIRREREKYQFARRLGHPVELSPRLKILFGVTPE